MTSVSDCELEFYDFCFSSSETAAWECQNILPIFERFFQLKVFPWPLFYCDIDVFRNLRPCFHLAIWESSAPCRWLDFFLPFLFIIAAAHLRENVFTLDCNAVFHHMTVTKAASVSLVTWSLSTGPWCYSSLWNPPSNKTKLYRCRDVNLGENIKLQGSTCIFFRSRWASRGFSCVLGHKNNIFFFFFFWRGRPREGW